MRVYVGGPMRSRPQFNFPAFYAAQRTLEQMGHVVFNPAERDASIGFDPATMTGDEDLAALGFALRDALAADMDWIAREADAVCVLPGWETSKGATAEVALARALGIPVGPIEVFDAAGCWPETPGEVRVTDPVTGGQKGSKEQRFDLVPIGPLTQLATLYGRGGRKYADRNWERGYDWSLSYAALMRHLTQWWGGEDLDPEMGLSHMTSVAWHAFALAEFEVEHPEKDDRPGHACAEMNS